jgi:hypothetical protein
VIAVGIHVMLFALMSIIYIHHEFSKDKGRPTAIAVGTERADAPLEVIQPPERIDRKKVPENTDAELVSYEEESFIPAEDVEEDLHLDIGDPTGTDDAQAGQTGGTAIGVGAGGGHYGAGTSPFSSRRVGSGKKKGRAGGPKVGTEEAVLEGLRWLVRHQGEDGSWGPDICRARCNPKSPCIPADVEVQPFWNEGLTGLALLAFLGQGLNHDSKIVLVDTAMGKKYVSGEIIKKGLQWLVNHQKEDGSFSAIRPFLYNEALATMALCEAYGLSRNPYFKRPAQRGVDFLVAAQKMNPQEQGELWGWRYSSRAELDAKKAAGEIDDATYYDQVYQVDISVTGWVIMALKSAWISGLDVPPEAMEGGLRYAKSVSRDDGLVGYIDLGGAGVPVGGPGDQYAYHVGTMSALSMLIRTFVTHDLDDPFFDAAAKQIVKDQPTITKDKLSIDYYYWYYATLALNQFDGPDSPRKSAGEYWNKWNDAMQDAILELQDETKERDVCSRGGWLVGDRWSRHGYAIYNTAINVLTLEVYYRYENAFGAGVRERAGPSVQAVKTDDAQEGGK